MQPPFSVGAGSINLESCMFGRIVIASAVVLAACFSSEARPLRATPPPKCNVSMPCDFSYSVMQTQRVIAPARNPERHGARSFQMSVDSSDSSGTKIVGGRPAGCPRSFCGCGAAIRVFGRIVPELNLAANWLRFPRTAPAPGMVAARRGHVFVLERHVAGDIWMAYDANSGGRTTRIHARSLKGYTIVNPRSA